MSVSEPDWWHQNNSKTSSVEPTSKGLNIQNE